METTWLNRAALYELLALGLRYPTDTLIAALTEGEYADALKEVSELNELDGTALAESLEDLAEYRNQESKALMKTLRVEYTFLYIGEKRPPVSPYAGVWWSHEKGITPLLFVNKESLAVKEFMRSCGIKKPADANEPLDHIATELEFLQYLCLCRADASLQPEFLEDSALPEHAYEDFYAEHFDKWSKQFAAATLEKARIPFYRALARMLACL